MFGLLKLLGVAIVIAAVIVVFLLAELYNALRIVMVM